MFALRDRFPASMSTMLLPTISRRLLGTARAAVVAALLGMTGGLASTAAAIPYPTPSAQIRRAPAPVHKKRHRAPKRKPARHKRSARHSHPAAAPTKPAPAHPTQSTPTSSALPSPPAQVSTPQQPTPVPLSPGLPITSAPLGGTTSPTSGTTPTPQLSSLLFAPTSVWNAPLSPTAALDPSSGSLVSGLGAEVTREEQAAIGPWITVGANIYVVGPNQPTVPVQLADTTGPVRSALQAAFKSVPIPAGAQPESDSDEELSVWQPSTDKLWEFFHMQLLSDGWHAAWGGAMNNVAESPGYYNANSWPGASPTWGATASSLPEAAGVITMADIQQGQIDHAIAVNLPSTCPKIYSWPAQRTDGDSTASNCIPEGAHLRLDPNLNIPAMHLPTFVQMMAEAAQTYGLIVRDQTAWCVGFWIQTPTSADTSSPFYNSNGAPSATGPFQGKWPNQLMSYFPWGSLQLLQMSGPGV
jgi:hypothetical protein